MRTTAREIIDGACDLIGAKAVGQALPAADAQDALRRLNALCEGLRLQPLSQPFLKREVFDLVADEQSYTIGVGGDFDTSTPETIEAAGLLLTTGSELIERPLEVYDDQEYTGITTKTLSSTYPSGVYFQRTFEDELGTITLWPVPDTAVNQLVLYRRDVVPGFSNLDTIVVIPAGYAEMLEYNLALRLTAPYGVTNIPPDVAERARTTLGTIKRAAYPAMTVQVQNDAASIGRRGNHGYNIFTGNL